MNFTHLHVHSHYSLLDGLPKIDELVNRAKELKMKALALTDHGVLYGAIEFYQKAKAAGLKPIIGLEAYLAPYGHLNKRPRVDERPHHLVLLAKNKTGYQNLIYLTTKAHLEGFYYKPRIDLALLKDRHEGLIALTACLNGEIPKTIKNGDLVKAEKLIKEYQDLFGQDNFFLEIQPHPHLEYQDRVNQLMIEFSKKLKVPLVATNDVHYLSPEDADPQDVLLCIQTKKKQSDPDRISYLGEDYSFRSTEEMTKWFKDIPEAIENTNQIANECNLEIEFGRLLLPYFETTKRKTADEYLKELCDEGVAKRFGFRPREKTKLTPLQQKIMERLEYELAVIKRTGFASYLLIVQDFVNWAKENQIVVGPGRGSAAGALVCYVLNITNIDPLKYDLMFERFLNPERITMPDIDMDFADSRRDEVIRYVEERYGKDNVAQIITFGTMASRAAIRDVGRVQGLPYSYCDRVAKLIPMFLSLDEALKTVPELKEIYESDPDGKKLIDTAKKLEGVARHSSTHACGVVITPKSLENYVPIQYASQEDKIVVTQYSWQIIEDLGLLKMDFLGLKNLTILENTISIIKKTAGQEIPIDHIPLDDKNTFSLFQEGKTIGVFQLESSGMTRYLKELKPTDLEDIIAMVSLYRPGPMELIPDYIAGKHGLKQITYLHPKLKPILEKTYGIAVYQEQILQIARDLAGFTLGEADLLRKAIGKKIKKLLLEQREKFIQGAIKNGIAKKIAEKLFDFVEPFARYGFNRSHAACYALIAYQTAYLKVHFPAQFLAALMTSDYGNIDRIAIEVAEAEQLGIKVLPPDVNESYSTFTVVKESLELNEPRIRFGLMAIKNIGTNIVRTIIDERKKDGPYQNLDDFLRRVKTKDLNKKSLESLIKCGALDIFGERQTLLDSLDAILTYAKNCQRETLNGQTNLFGMLPVVNSPKLKLKESPPASKKQKLAWEKELLGMYISEHPLTEFSSYLEKITIPIKKVAEKSNGFITIGGVITQIQRIITKTQEPMLFVKIEDLSGNIEVLVFPSTLKENPAVWQEDKILVIAGRLSNKEGVTKLICQKAKELNPEQVNNNLEKIVQIKVPQLKKELMAKLKSVFDEHPGHFRVHLTILSDNNPKTIVTKTTIDYNEKVIEKIKLILGKETIIVKI